jgi:hypothetical protein
MNHEEQASRQCLHNIKEKIHEAANVIDFQTSHQQA